MKSPWLGWIQQLQAIAQNGLTYSKDPFDRRRFEDLLALTAQMLSSLSDEPPKRVLDRFHQEYGAATPKVDVRGVILRESWMLLVREKRNGLWTLPGGWAEVGLSPGESIAKEVKEEAGYIVKPMRLLGLYDRSRHQYAPHPNYIYKVFFQCELVKETALDDLETDAVAFFAEDALPPLYEAQVTHAQLSRMFELTKDPMHPADLD